jgi:tRNA uridine 5-carboxymethylaminomethyl modification enzyme
MFKVFFREIDLEDILKFDKVRTYVSENDLDQRNFGTSRDSGKIFWILKGRNNADKLLAFGRCKNP